MEFMQLPTRPMLGVTVADSDPKLETALKKKKRKKVSLGKVERVLCYNVTLDFFSV